MIFRWDFGLDLRVDARTNEKFGGYYTGRTHIVKMEILTKAVYRFNVTPTKLPMIFFHRTIKITQKFIGNHKITKIAKAMGVG